MDLLNFIITKTELPQKSVANTIELFNEDCTIPFISRYRKEKTGNLDEVQISSIFNYKKKYEELDKRKTSILKSISEQTDVTEALKGQILAAQDLNTLEDLYLPFKRKRKSKAEKARLNGLEPLAKIIMSQKAQLLDTIAVKYLNDEILDIDAALQGSRHIIAEWMNERQDLRNKIRWHLNKFARIQTKVVKSKAENEKALKFKDYFDWEEALRTCPSHRLLAILRAEREGFIRLKI
jgi:uncharacterized protein